MPWQEQHCARIAAAPATEAGTWNPLHKGQRRNSRGSFSTCMHLGRVFMRGRQQETTGWTTGCLASHEGGGAHHQCLFHIPPNVFLQGFEKTGLGERIANLFVRAMGKSTLGLALGLNVAETILAPAMPSTSARAGGGSVAWGFLGVPG